MRKIELPKAMSDHFRLKEIDRIEAEKKCMIVLKKVINICLKRNYHFSVNTECGNINMTFDAYVETSFSSYYKGQLIDFSDGNTLTITELLNLLQSKK